MPLFEFRHGDPAPEIWGAMLFPDDDVKRESYIGGARISYFPEHFGENAPALMIDAAHQADWKRRPDVAEVADRLRHGMIAGQLMKVVFQISADDPAHASWNTAAKLVSRAHYVSVRSIWSYKDRFLPVLHLWGAWGLRGGHYHDDAYVNYSRADDLQMFLSESMALLGWARQFVRPADKAEPLISPETASWIAPPSWDPPSAAPGWPRDGRLRQAHLTEKWLDMIGKRKPLQPKLQN